jgi:hypothetical protein
MKLLDKISAIILALFILWFAVSTIEVGHKNKAPNPQYSPINFWTILVKEVQN